MKKRMNVFTLKNKNEKHISVSSFTEKEYQEAMEKVPKWKLNDNRFNTGIFMGITERVQGEIQSKIQFWKGDKFLKFVKLKREEWNEKKRIERQIEKDKKHIVNKPIDSFHNLADEKYNHTTDKKVMLLQITKDIEEMENITIKEIFKMYVDNFTQKEISQKLKKSQAYVSKTIKKVTEILKKKYKKLE